MPTKPCALTFCVQCGQHDEKGANGKSLPNPANQALMLEVREILQTNHPEAYAQLAVRLSRCQGGCKRPCAWQLAGQHEGVRRESLQWGDGSSTLAADIATAAAQYTALLPHQKLTKAIFPPSLRGKLLARLFPWPKPKGYR